jgi:hypothetical protein
MIWTEKAGIAVIFQTSIYGIGCRVSLLMFFFVGNFWVDPSSGLCVASFQFLTSSTIKGPEESTLQLLLSDL